MVRVDSRSETTPLTQDRDFRDRLQGSSIQVLLGGEDGCVLLSTEDLIGLAAGSKNAGRLPATPQDILLAVRACLDRGDTDAVVDLRPSELTRELLDDVADNFGMSEAREVPVFEGGKAALDAVLRQSRSAGGETVRGTLAGGVERDVLLDVLSSGRLRVEGSTATGADALAEAASLVQLAQKDSPTNPFDSIHDPKALRAVVGLHGQAFERLAQLGDREPERVPPGMNTWAEQTPSRRRQTRAALLAVVRLATERLVSLDSHAAPALTARLGNWVRAEPNRLLQKAELKFLTSSEILGGHEKIAELEPLLRIDTPNYDALWKDGRLRVQVYYDEGGTTRGMLHDYFGPTRKGQGYEIASGTLEDDGEPLVLTKEVVAPDGSTNTIELVLAPSPKAAGESPAIFEKMADPETDVIVYTGHAGYGRRVDAAVESGVEGTGKDKIVALMQCGSIWNLEKLTRAFPDAEIVGTVEGTNLSFWQPGLAMLLTGLAERRSWPEIQSKLGAFPSNTSLVSDSHFFTPSTDPSLLDSMQDLDRDGIKLDADRLFREPVADRLRTSATGFNPVQGDVEYYELGAGALNAAVRDVNLSLGYNDLGLPVEAGAVVGGGVRPAQAGSVEAFEFELNEGTGEVSVWLCESFVHANDAELSKMLAFELGVWAAERAGQGRSEAVAHGLAAYWQSCRHFAGDGRSDAFAHGVFLARYGLPDISLHGLRALAPRESGDSHGSFTEATIGPFVAALSERCDGEADIGRPRLIGQSVDLGQAPPSVFDGLHFGDMRTVSASRLEKLVRSVPGYGDARLTTGSTLVDTSEPLQPLTLAVDRNGELAHLVLQFDAHGIPLALHDLGALVSARTLLAESLSGSGTLGHEIEERLCADLHSNMPLARCFERAAEQWEDEDEPSMVIEWLFDRARSVGIGGDEIDAARVELMRFELAEYWRATIWPDDPRATEYIERAVSLFNQPVSRRAAAEKIGQLLVETGLPESQVSRFYQTIRGSAVWRHLKLGADEPLCRYLLAQKLEDTRQVWAGAIWPDGPEREEYADKLLRIVGQQGADNATLDELRERTRSFIESTGGDYERFPLLPRTWGRVLERHVAFRNPLINQLRGADPTAAAILRGAWERLFEDEPNVVSGDI